jgi:hypothetical protein
MNRFMVFSDDSKGNRYKAMVLARDRCAEAMDAGDIHALAERLSLPGPNAAGSIGFMAFDRHLVFDSKKCLLSALDGKELSIQEEIIVLRYLSNGGRNLGGLATRPGKFLSFRDFPGGLGYEEPFRARTVVPLARKIGSDIERLKRNLEGFMWRPFDAGDFGAMINIIGSVDMALVYRMPDDEFSAEASIMFGLGVKLIFDVEDLVVISEIVCRSLWK